MSLRVDLPDELAERVTLAASERGVPADVIVAEAVAKAFPEKATPRPRRHLALAGIGESENGLTHRIDEMLAEGFGQD